MAIHYNDLEVASLIQEKKTLSLAQLSTHFNKSTSSIKRSIAAVNEYLPENAQIRINNNQAVFQMTYTQYLAFIRELTIRDYVPSQKERFYAIAAQSFLHFSANMSELYEFVYLSLSTKKKDSHQFSEWLAQYDLSTKTISKAGIQIVGDELQFRMIMAGRLCKNVELNQNFEPTLRLADNPLQKMLTLDFFQEAGPVFPQVRTLLQKLLAQTKCRISYASMKFLFLYLSCSLFRSQHGRVILKEPNCPLPATDHRLLDLPQENAVLNKIISALDATPLALPPVEDKLANIVSELVDVVQTQIITGINNEHRIYQELYLYMHKILIRNIYHFSFYDNKLEETQEKYANLYNIVSLAVQPFEEAYSFHMNDLQVAGMTLIFRKYIEKNKHAGRNRKRLVIVTNSSSDKIEFFMELLKTRVEVELVEVINIHELYQLKQLEYDHLITFSNRIVTLLSEEGYPCIKLHFYLGEEDFRSLMNQGFSTSKRKLRASTFLSSLEEQDADKKISFLLKNYSDYFME